MAQPIALRYDGCMTITRNEGSVTYSASFEEADGTWMAAAEPTDTGVILTISHTAQGVVASSRIDLDVHNAIEVANLILDAVGDRDSDR